ncbi:hypothetical protein EII20_12850 [Comamonadaceae bacterium OH2545_COT-014]|nr:hypothetical protein EII20_12850 [Comamonadaceae bacterium OH2545_COT-014]
MGIALTSSSFAALLTPAFRRHRSATTGQAGAWQSHALARGQQHAASITTAPAYRAEPPAAPRASHARALRVVHVADPNCGGTSARMLISGRMADVCAELDRLARQEAHRQARH